MSRVRISTTVDSAVWEELRRLVAGPASRLVDSALRELLTKLETDRERAALQAAPYAGDPQLNWESSPEPDLPYDADVPSDVLDLARARREQAGE